MRDLAKDAELCNKATPGPWWHTESEQWCTQVLVLKELDSDPEKAVKQYDLQIFASTKNVPDAKFIAESREGWPEAIEMAIKAKALNRKLEKALELACERLACEFGAHPDGGKKTFWKKHFLKEAERCLE